MRIVVVEDEAPIREGMAKILSKINTDYKVVGTAVDGEKGLELIRKEQPDLVIMDIRMPHMTGLEMLSQLRHEQNKCKVIVLSAYSDFAYAKQAIELGIENYLLKPINIVELKKALQQAEAELVKAQNQDRAFSLEYIFNSCINGHLQPDDAFHKMTQEKYGFTVRDSAEIMLIWLGEAYEMQIERLKLMIEQGIGQRVSYSMYMQEMEIWQSLVIIFYKNSQNTSLYTYLSEHVLPAVYKRMEIPMVSVWKQAEEICSVSSDLKEMYTQLEWALLFEEGKLIRVSEIELKQESIQNGIEKYPMELEELAKKAMLIKDKEQLKYCYHQLPQYYQNNPQSPMTIKKDIIRFFWALAKVGGLEIDGKESDIQEKLNQISGAVCWLQIQKIVEQIIQIIQNLEEKKSPEEHTSAMVQKAQQLILQYYDQGITLEEIAGKLVVSEEYLSTQFKKETGMTFSETVRKYRIEKVKKLLLETPFKLNQIAELAGYSDSKYMSKVFKEEVGMLPSEYRKSLH